MKKYTSLFFSIIVTLSQGCVYDNTFSIVGTWKISEQKWIDCVNSSKNFDSVCKSNCELITFFSSGDYTIVFTNSAGTYSYGGRYSVNDNLLTWYVSNSSYISSYSETIYPSGNKLFLSMGVGSSQDPGCANVTVLVKE